MNIHISRPEVLNNLIRFKDKLLEMREDERERGKAQKRKYKVLLNRKTGEMRFAQKISLLEQKIYRTGTKSEAPESWKEIQIIVKDVDSHASHFEIRDLENKSLKESEVEPLAWKVTNETIEVLNKKAKSNSFKSGKLPEEEILKDLSSIHFAAAFELIENHPAWMGSMSRIDAEKILENEPIGTYLLREGDEITVSTSFHMAEENHLWIHPYLLTASEPEKKIVDILLLHTDRGWIRYIDDPDLNDSMSYHYVPTLKELISQIKEFSLIPYKKRK